MKRVLASVQEQFHPSPQVLAEFAELLEPRAFAKGTSIIQAGKPVQYMHFIEQGIVRSYFQRDVQAVTLWFLWEGDVFTSIYSFITGKASTETVEAVEDCVLYVIPFDKLRAWFDRSHEAERIARLMMALAFLRQEQFIYASKFLSSRERYDRLAEQAPELIHRVPLGLIASYLGMTQETLSRIRGAKPR